MAQDFRSFYNTHSSLVRRVAFQIAGRSLQGPALDDLVQEAFVKIWRGLDEFRNASEVTTWIYRITTNAALDHLKSLKRRKENLEGEWPELEENRNRLDDVQIARDLVQRGLETLSEDHRVILVLVFIHERPLLEVAEILSIPEGTVKSRLSSAKSAFLKYLESKGVSSHDKRG